MLEVNEKGKMFLYQGLHFKKAASQGTLIKQMYKKYQQNAYYCKQEGGIRRWYSRTHVDWVSPLEKQMYKM